MIKRIALSMAGLAGVAALPVALFSGMDFWKTARTATGSPATAAALPPGDPLSLPAGQPGPATVPGTAAPVPSLEGIPPRDLAEVLRFDVTPDWIMRRWPRVTTGLAQLPLQGYRVPLVTGTSEADLAGALTYYFNAHQQVQRITFRGTTGDARNLLALLMGRYRFARRLVNDPGLLVYEAVTSAGKPAGSLRMRSAPIVKATDPYHRFDIELVMERPE